MEALSVRKHLPQTFWLTTIRSASKHNFSGVYVELDDHDRKSRKQLLPVTLLIYNAVGQQHPTVDWPAKSLWRWKWTNSTQRGLPVNQRINLV